MDVTAGDIHEKQFHDAWRGYNQEEVDDFLDRIAESIDRLGRENVALQQRIRELDQQVSTSHEAEEMLKKTLVTAQQAAEEAISSAKGKAERLIAEAEQRARKASEDVKERIASAESDAQRRAQETDREFNAKKRELDASIDSLAAFERDLKSRLKAFLEGQLRALDGLIERAPPGGRPAPTAPDQGRLQARPATSGSPTSGEHREER